MHPLLRRLAIVSVFSILYTLAACGGGGGGGGGGDGDGDGDGDGGTGGINNSICDSGLASDSIDGLDYAKAFDICQTTTISGTDQGIISAELTLTNGLGVPASVSRALRGNFGLSNLPQAGSAMVVLSTGAAASIGQTNPSFASFQTGTDTGTSSTAPADWLSANGNAFPTPPGCPSATSTTAFDPVMLTLTMRVPSNAHSFSFKANFLSAGFPEDLCSAYNDTFVALLDSTYSGVSPNPSDKNLAITAMGAPISVSAAGYSQCLNGNTGCTMGATAGTYTLCVGSSALADTGMDLIAIGWCDNSVVGGGTGWMTISGNVVPNETITLRLAIWDTSDHQNDSVVLLDSFRWSENNVVPGTTF